MSDKERIKQEIERRYNCEKCYPNDREASVAAAVLQELLLFINSLPEEHNEDLEEEIEYYLDYADFKSKCNGISAAQDYFEDIKNTARHFAEWQKQQMMKDNVEGTVKYEIGSAEIPQCDRRYQVLSNPTSIANAKLGDKVKIVVLKTE